MEKRKTIEEDEVDEIVDTLLDMPVSNLEERLNRIKSEISMRGIIFKGTLESLGTRRVRIEEDLKKTWYSAMLGLDAGRRFTMERELISTQNREMDEWLAYFKDMKLLQGSLQEAKQEVELEKQKRKLAK